MSTTKNYFKGLNLDNPVHIVCTDDNEDVIALNKMLETQDRSVTIWRPLDIKSEIDSLGSGYWPLVDKLLPNIKLEVMMLIVSFLEGNLVISSTIKEIDVDALETQVTEGQSTAIEHSDVSHFIAYFGNERDAITYRLIADRVGQNLPLLLPRDNIDDPAIIVISDNAILLHK